VIPIDTTKGASTKQGMDSNAKCGLTKTNHLMWPNGILTRTIRAMTTVGPALHMILYGATRQIPTRRRTLATPRTTQDVRRNILTMLKFKITNAPSQTAQVDHSS